MQKNTKLLLILITIAVGMLGVSYAFVPLYKLFCQTFGIPTATILVGQEGVAKHQFKTASNRTVTVRFMANDAAGIPVELTPTQSKITAQLGVPALTAYRANNTSAKPMDGVAVHTILAMGGETISGFNINDFVELQQCFCFEQQHYPANEEITLPLSFTITPDLPKQIHTITFAYTLFEDENTPQAN